MGFVSVVVWVAAGWWLLAMWRLFRRPVGQPTPLAPTPEKPDFPQHRDSDTVPAALQSAGSACVPVAELSACIPLPGTTLLPTMLGEYRVVVSYHEPVHEQKICRVGPPYEALFKIDAPNAAVARKRALERFESDRQNSSVHWVREVIAVTVIESERVPEGEPPPPVSRQYAFEQRPPESNISKPERRLKMTNNSDGPRVRTTWLSMLKDSLSLIDESELMNPEGEADESAETILGVAPMEERKMFTYAERLEEQATRMLVDARFTREDSGEKERLVKKSFELTMKSSLARDMLWTNLKDEFDCWAPHLYIGLRKDFVVVSGRRKEEENNK